MNAKRKDVATTWALPGDLASWRTEVVAVTPKIAELMLSHNRENRPVSSALVARLAAKMDRDEWVFTHQGIAFDKTGRLLDGQHRLAAVVKSGKTVNLLVTYGLDNVFDHIDILGKARTAGDLLSIRLPGTKNAKLKVATAHMMLKGIVCSSNRYRPDEVARYAEQQLNLISAFVDVLGKSVALTKKSPIMAAFAAAARQEDGWPGPRGYRDRDTVLLSAMRLAEQEWSGKRDPLRVLFQRLLRHSTSSSAGHNLEATEMYALTVSAVRADIAGKQLATITATEVDWGDKVDYGGPKVVKKRPKVDRSRVEKMRASRRKDDA